MYFTFHVTSESKKKRQITVLYTNLIRLGFFESDVRYVKFHLFNLNCKTITLFVATENGKLPSKCSLFSAFGGISKYVTYSVQHHQFYACYFLIMINVRPLFHFPSLFFFFRNCKTESFGNWWVCFYFILHTIAFLDKYVLKVFKLIGEFT